MKVFNAKQVQSRPSFVYRSACRGPIKITHRNFGDMILISPDSIFSTHQHIDGTVTIHLRSIPYEILKKAAANNSEGKELT